MPVPTTAKRKETDEVEKCRVARSPFSATKHTLYQSHNSSLYDHNSSLTRPYVAPTDRYGTEIIAEASTDHTAATIHASRRQVPIVAEADVGAAHQKKSDHGIPAEETSVMEGRVASVAARVDLCPGADEQLHRVNVPFLQILGCGRGRGGRVSASLRYM